MNAINRIHWLTVSWYPTRQYRTFILHKSLKADR